VALRELDIFALPGLWMLLKSCLFGPKPDPGLATIPEDQQLQIADILGATCTLANIGMVVTGHQTVTVIIPPEVTMFGIGDLHQAPMVINGEVVPRWVITMCITFDHRAFDAGEGFPMYAVMKRCIDNPALIYNWKPGDTV
jgi:pyruvate/2-oxoglutarate dehydrogenase complex dihydrolipoamide acyltransferase (E2) component